MNDNRLSKTRLFFIFFFFVAVLACLLVRLGFIQIFKSNTYLSIAQNQSQATIQMQPVRGRVLDRFGRELALEVRLDWEGSRLHVPGAVGELRLEQELDAALVGAVGGPHYALSFKATSACPVA